MTSVFNPTEFLAQTHEAGFSTKRPLLPEDEYPGQIAEDRGNIKGIDVKADNSKKTGEVFYVLTINWEIISDKAKDLTGLDKPLVKQDIFLDLDEHGRLKKDKTSNIDLGRLLAGLDLNIGSFTFQQLRAVGLCKLKVGLTKPNDKGEQYNRVNAVVKYTGA